MKITYELSPHFRRSFKITLKMLDYPLIVHSSLTFLVVGVVMIKHSLTGDIRFFWLMLPIFFKPHKVSYKFMSEGGCMFYCMSLKKHVGWEVKNKIYSVCKYPPNIEYIK